MRSRVLSVLGRRTKATLPELPYEYHALEPFISADIMELHHSKHHATYVNNLNVANEALQEASSKGDVTKCVQLANAIKFNGGGHVNHTIFWQVSVKPQFQILNFDRTCLQTAVASQKALLLRPSHVTSAPSLPSRLKCLKLLLLSRAPAGAGSDSTRKLADFRLLPARTRIRLR